MTDGCIAFQITSARYAKGKRLIRPMDSRDGMKGRSSYLANNLGGRWSNREKGYILSIAAADKFLILFEKGFEGDLCTFADQKPSFSHREKRLENLTLASALKIAKEL